MLAIEVFLKGLYYGRSRRAEAYRYGLLGLNVLAILTFFMGSYGRHVAVPVEYSSFLLLLEVSVGLLLLLELVTRLWTCGNKLRCLLRFATLMDGVTAVTFIVTDLMNLGFLRIFKVVDMVRSVRAYGHIHYSYRMSSRSEYVFSRSLNLFVFVIVVAEIVYVAQVDSNEMINSYMDALYFTLMTLTTTGFGDITLVGVNGRWLTIIIMVLGVTLFLRLIHTVLSPPKSIRKCPRCGFDKHELEASYCNRCGALIKPQDL